MRDLVYQSNFNSCGYASLRSFLILFTKRKSFRYLRSQKKERLSLKELSSLAEEHGIIVKWRQAFSSNCLKEAKNTPYLLLLKDQKSEHLVVLKRVRKNKALIWDPEQGWQAIELKKLEERWSLIYGEGKKSENISAPLKIKFLNRQLLTFTIVSLFFFVFAFLFFLFALSCGNFLFMGILMTISLLSAIAFLLSVHLLFKDFKRRYQSLFFDKEKLFEEDFLIYERFRAQLYGPILRFSAFLSVSIAIYLFLLKESFLLLSGSLFLLALFPFIYFALFKPFKESLSKLEKEETHFMKHINEERKKIIKLEKKAARLAFYKGIMLFAILALVILASLIPSFLTKVFLLDSFLFGISVNFVLFECLKEIFLNLTSLGDKRLFDAFFERFY